MRTTKSKYSNSRFDVGKAMHPLVEEGQTTMAVCDHCGTISDSKKNISSARESPSTVESGFEIYRSKEAIIGYFLPTYCRCVRLAQFNTIVFPFCQVCQTLDGRRRKLSVAWSINLIRRALLQYYAQKPEFCKEYSEADTGTQNVILHIMNTVNIATLPVPQRATFRRPQLYYGN
jgi:hypothetical protein